MKRVLYSLLLILGHSTVICLSIDAILEFGEPDDPEPVNLEDLGIDVLPVGPPSTTGQKVQKVRQVFKGFDVLGYGGTFEEKNGALKKVVIGTFVTGIENDVTSMVPLVTKEAAVKTAFESLTVAGVTTSFQPDDSQNPNFRLQIYVDTVKLRAVLVYQLNFLVSRLKFGELVDVFNAFVTVDAITGDILRSLEQIAGFKARSCEANSSKPSSFKVRRFQAKSFLMRGDGYDEKLGRYRYGEGKLISKPLNVTKISRTRCELANQYVNVSSAAGCDFLSRCFSERFIERCNLRTPNEDHSASNTSQAHDALFFATEYIKMMREVFEDKTLEEKCTQVKLCTSYGVTNSFSHPSNPCAIYFGSSGNDTYDQVSASIVGHELAHLVTLSISGREQTDALIESFCDLSALVFKAYLNNTPEDSVWMFGNEIRIEKDNQTAVRYIDDPPRDGFSVDCMENYLLKPPTGSGDTTHFNNGIYNKAIYFLVTDYKDWTLNKVFRMLLMASKRYWYETVGFTKGLCGLILAAENLEYNTEDLRDSFAKVGVFCGCPKHWIRVKQNTGNSRHKRIRCFKVITDEMTWSNARTHCNQIGGYLVSLDNESKAESLLSVIVGKPRQYWIGGSELLANPKEKLVWPFGQKFNWPDSLTGQPKEADTTYNCLTVVRRRQKLGLTNDRCDKQKQFVCEKTCCGKNCANIS